MSSVSGSTSSVSATASPELSVKAARSSKAKTSAGDADKTITDDSKTARICFNFIPHPPLFSPLLFPILPYFQMESKDIAIFAADLALLLIIYTTICLFFYIEHHRVKKIAYSSFHFCCMLHFISTSVSACTSTAMPSGKQWSSASYLQPCWPQKGSYRSHPSENLPNPSSSSSSWYDTMPLLGSAGL